MNFAFAKEVGLVPYVARRLGWRMKGLLRSQAMIRLPNGVDLPAPRASLSAADACVTRGNIDWGAEWILAEYLRLRPGSTFVDVGANVGYYCAVAAPWAASIHAFDPDPRNREPLAALARLLPAMSFHPLGVSDFEGSAFLNPGVESSTSSLGPPRPDAIPIQVTSLAAFFENRNESVGAVKVDVEGYEIQVLEGARPLLCRQRPLVLTEFNIEPGKPNAPEKLARLTADLGLRIHAIVREDPSPWRCEYRLLPVRPERLQEVWFKMLFLTHASDALMLRLIDTYSTPWSMRLWQVGPRHAPTPRPARATPCNGRRASRA